MVNKIARLVLIGALLTCCLFAQVPQTPTIGLKVPPHGTRNWDSWYDQNWYILDSVIGGLQTGVEHTSNKGTPNGYPSLDSTGKVPSAQLPPAGLVLPGVTSNGNGINVAGPVNVNATLSALNINLTGSTPARCIHTDSSGNLVASSTDCGPGGGGKIYNGSGNPNLLNLTPIQSLDASGYDNFVISMASVTIGHTMIAATSAAGACTVPTDTQNNVYSLAGTFGTYTYITNVYFASILSSGADVISSHCSGAYQMFAASEIPTALLVDASGGAVSENLGLLSAIVTPTHGGDFIYTAVPSGSGINNQYPGAGQTALTNTWGPMGSLTEWTIAPTAGAFTSSATVSSVNENMAVVAFYSTNPTVGNDGDFYFDSAAGTFYGPKAGGSWLAVPIFQKSVPFQSLPTCNSAYEGASYPVTDGSTVILGGPASNGGTCHERVTCDGTAWYVASVRLGSCSGPS